MAVLTTVCVWLALQCAGSAAAAEDPERCTDEDVVSQVCRSVGEPRPAANEMGLLQASVGKHLVQIVNLEEADMNATEQQFSLLAGNASEGVTLVTAAREPLPPQPLAAHPALPPLAAHLAAHPSSTSRSTSRAAAVAPVTQEPSSSENRSPQPAASKSVPSSSQSLNLVAAASSSTSSQDAVASAWTRLTHSSLFGEALTMAQSCIQHIQKRFPDTLVAEFPSLKTTLGAVQGLALVSILIWCTLVGFAARFYKSNKPRVMALSSRPESDFNDWTSGPFDMFSDWKVCCWSCWCPCIRWADTMDMLGIVGFWVGLLVFCGLVLLNAVPGGLLLWFVASLLWMSFRQQLRMKFDMEHNTFKTFMGDWSLYCCCFPCAIAQEARHIEEACRADHKAIRNFDAV